MEKHFAVIGDPIAHSLSPLMHMAGYGAVGLEAEYQRFRVKTGDLGDAVKGLRALGFSGWNVTIPHKESIIPYLDELTPEAARAGAVNTVKCSNGKLIGHNTDGAGFGRSVQEYMGAFTGKTAVLLGAGGAAKGIALALAEQGMPILVLNRSVDKAEELARQIQAHGGKASAGGLQIGAWLDHVDLLVQTTSVGLQGESYPISLQGIRPEAMVVDIIYRPWETPFLQEAKTQGCQTLNGLPMFLHQGGLAWEFWLGTKAPLPQMWAALLHEVEHSD